MRSLLWGISGFLLTVFQLSAEIIPVQNWTLNMNPIPAVSGRRDEEPLRDFIDVKNNTIFLKHPLYGIKSYSGSTKARPGLLRISFTAQALNGAVSHGVVKVVMYGYHFRNDNCTGKSEDLFLEKDFSVSGKKSLSVDFNITPEQLKCIFCDEQVPTFRFFTTFYLKENSSGIALSNITISAATPLLVYGRKQISTTTWLLDELKADKAKDAERAALKKELETPVVPVKVTPKPLPAKKAAPVEVAIPIEKFISQIEPEFPALFDAVVTADGVLFEKYPANSSQKITLLLNPPSIPENCEYVLVIDRNVWNWSHGIYDKDDRPLDKNGGYLPGGTPIMRLPYNCRRIDFESNGEQEKKGYIKRVFYREIKKKK